jgi:hypothetical protein
VFAKQKAPQQQLRGLFHFRERLPI